MRYAPISNDLFRMNRSKLVKKLTPDSCAIITSADNMPRNGDAYFPYRQSSDFFYLTGICQEETMLILLSDGTEILFIQKADSQRIIWEGPKLSQREATAISGITTIKYCDDFDNELRSILNRFNAIYLNKNENIRYQSKIATAEDRLISELKALYPLHTFHRLAPLITSLRLKKEPEEIALMEKSIAITGKAFNRVLKTIKPGMKEFEVEAEILHEFAINGAQHPAFETIVASGENACYLHYIKNDKTIADGELVLIDFGAEYANYSADCSRTIPANGTFNSSQREVYNACLDVYFYTQSIIKPGTTLNEVQTLVCKKMESELIILGLFTSEDVKHQDPNNPLYKQFFMHGVSHFLGLDTHDVGSKTDILKPGMVVTCEPGIYIPNEQIGIRIETDLLITHSGNRDLMAEFPVYPSDIEKIMCDR